jgi:hypothetical protein
VFSNKIREYAAVGFYLKTRPKENQLRIGNKIMLKKIYLGALFLCLAGVSVFIQGTAFANEVIVDAGLQGKVDFSLQQFGAELKASLRAERLEITGVNYGIGAVTENFVSNLTDFDEIHFSFNLKIQREDGSTILGRCNAVQIHRFSQIMIEDPNCDWKSADKHKIIWAPFKDRNLFDYGNSEPLEV